MKSNFKQVKLDIKSEQRENSRLCEDFNEINHSADGKHCRRTGKDYLIYEEKNLEGMEDSITNLRVEENKVVMKRNGKVTTRMEFVLNEETEMRYRCPEGIMSMNIFTENIEHIREENGDLKKVDVKYVLKFGDGYRTYNRISIEIDYK